MTQPHRLGRHLLLDSILWHMGNKDESFSTRARYKEMRMKRDNGGVSVLSFHLIYALSSCPIFPLRFSLGLQFAASAVPQLRFTWQQHPSFVCLSLSNIHFDSCNPKAKHISYLFHSSFKSASILIDSAIRNSGDFYLICIHFSLSYTVRLPLQDRPFFGLGRHIPGLDTHKSLVGWYPQRHAWAVF